MRKILITSAFLLSGCSAGNSLYYSHDAYKKTDMDVMGIPTVLGIGTLGTRFPVTPHYSLTAKHVAKYSLDNVVAYNKECDIALVKSNNSDKSLPVFSSAGVDIPVINYGYSFISALPVESPGKTNRYIKLENSYNSLKCPVILSTAGVRKGMSGGPVYNSQNNNIIGINISYTNDILNNKNGVITEEKFSGSMFIPFQNFKVWLENEINKTEDKDLLKIDHRYDFYNNDSGDKEKDFLKNKPYLEKL